jgi:hypothetical protein
MLKIRYLVVIVIVVYLFFLLARLPAAWFAVYANKALAQQNISLTSVVGTVWSGSANIQTNSTFLEPLQSSQLVWNLRFNGLWQGQIRTDFQINGGALQLQGQAQLGRKHIGLKEISGEISALLLNSILVNSLKVSQPLKLSRVTIKLNRSSKPSILASGSLLWSQGTMVLAQNPGQTLNMPDIMATLSSINSGIQLIAKAQDDEVLTIKVDPMGMATITVWQRILSVMGRESSMTNPEGTLIELNQKVF